MNAKCRVIVSDEYLASEYLYLTITFLKTIGPLIRQFHGDLIEGSPCYDSNFFQGDPSVCSLHSLTRGDRDCRIKHGRRNSKPFAKNHPYAPPYHLTLPVILSAVPTVFLRRNEVELIFSP